MSKGDRRERQAVRIYQRSGFATYRPATVRFGENDMFGLFDLLAISPWHSHVRAIQVKSNSAAGVQDWANHTWLWRRHNWRTRYLVPYDDEGWRLIECTDDGHETLYDERKDDYNMREGLIKYLRGEI